MWARPPGPGRKGAFARHRSYGANILAAASRLTVRLGENAPPGQDTARNGRQAVALARAGLTLAQDSAPPALAFGGDLRRCFTGIGDTEQALKFGAMALHDCEPWVVRGRAPGVRGTPQATG